MTLDLGFAHLRFEDGIEGGVVDVPGHERFLHNMLAGAAGMELLLLVVDASEGVMPQTLEHLDILRFLNVHRTIVVVTKIDLIDPQRVPDAVASICERLRGTIAEDAPAFAVSATTGENLDRLKQALHDELASLPSSDPNAPIYLPVDRVFTLPGHGTIVTGTLMQGRIEVGERVAVEPGHKTAQVRSIHVFGSHRDRVDAGSRVALNLPAIDRQECRRGAAIVGPELAARQDFTVRFTPLQSALALLRRRTPVRAYIGSAEVLGTLIADEVSTETQEVRAQLHLREPIVAFPGARFIVRRPSPKTLLGGGYVDVVEVRTHDRGVGDTERAVLAVLRERGLQAVDAAPLAAAANLREVVTIAALERLVARGDVIALSRPPGYVDAEPALALLARVLGYLEEAHAREQWALGVTSIGLSRALEVPEPILVRVLAAFVEDGRLANRNGYYATLDHRPSLTPEQLALFEELVPLDKGQPFLPTPFAAVATAVKRTGVAGASKAFDTMLAGGVLVKVGDELYRGTQIAAIRARVETFLRVHERMTAADFRDLLGTSRKYAVPLLEWLDARAFTIRDGDYRMLRKRPPS